MDFIVVGIGFWGREWCKLLKTHQRASVVATVDVNEAAANWSQNEQGIPCYPSLADAAEKVPADAVLVVTNPGQHKPVIIEALRLGKHVLVGKPMVTKSERGEDATGSKRLMPNSDLFESRRAFQESGRLSKMFSIFDRIQEN
jgi:predicted dehydrogenase